MPLPLMTFVSGLIAMPVVWALESANSIDQYIFQAGGVGGAIFVGFWLIRRYDERADKAADIATKSLEAEREAHAATRKQLFDLLKEHSSDHRSHPKSP